MNFLDLMKLRYTTKKYNPNYKVEAEKIETLKEILNLSPSSINSQPWTFVFIDNEDLKKELAEFSFHNKEKVLNCSHVVVFNAIDDIKYLEKHLTENLPEYAINYYNAMIKQKPEHEIKSWLQKQVYISLGVFLTACPSLEIDATPMEGIETDKYTEILKLEHHKTVFAVCIGKRDDEDSNQPNVTPKRRIAKEKNILEI